GLALLAAWAWMAVRPRQSSALAAFLLVIFTAIAAGPRDFSHGGDWRQAIETVNRVSDERTLILVRSGFVESTRLDWRDESQRTGFLFAPQAIYPAKGQLVRLPYGFDSAARSYLREWLSTQKRDAGRFILLTSGDDSYELWLSAQLADRQV